jgi:copper chaperone CopZ
MAGPASNMATIGAIYAGLGKKILAVYLGTIMVGSVALGMAADFVIDPEVIARTMEHQHTSLIGSISAVALLLFVVKFAADDVRRFFARRKTVSESDPMTVIGIGGMTCNGCTGAVENVLRKIEGVSNVVVNLEPGQAIVHGAIDLQRLQSAIVAAGYELRDDG